MEAKLIEEYLKKTENEKEKEELIAAVRESMVFFPSDTQDLLIFALSNLPKEKQAVFLETAKRLEVLGDKSLLVSLLGQQVHFRVLADAISAAATMESRFESGAERAVGKQVKKLDDAVDNSESKVHNLLTQIKIDLGQAATDWANLERKWSSLINQVNKFHEDKNKSAEKEFSKKEALLDKKVIAIEKDVERIYSNKAVEEISESVTKIVLGKLGWKVVGFLIGVNLGVSATVGIVLWEIFKKTAMQ
ncbi:hypothetical protein LFL96_26040 [Paraburkholderia sp. D15]|uniref:hypothetical protein n=1 Tax=Paraburkholderia sp. D15 TaxID=2880218 RepID=UPI00247A1CF3|nr:hypothetical protein [Paraburkholderia sp. D15]WGS54478.1 hypothetical protein LFL96_26040 [Paraburkholderia sp. D15]